MPSALNSTHTIGSYQTYDTAEKLLEATTGNVVSALNARRSVMANELSGSSDPTFSAALNREIQMCDKAIDLYQRKTTMAPPPEPAPDYDLDPLEIIPNSHSARSEPPPDYD